MSGEGEGEGEGEEEGGGVGAGGAHSFCFTRYPRRKPCSFDAVRIPSP